MVVFKIVLNANVFEYLVQMFFSLFLQYPCKAIPVQLKVRQLKLYLVKVGERLSSCLNLQKMIDGLQ